MNSRFRLYLAMALAAIASGAYAQSSTGMKGMNMDHCMEMMDKDSKTSAQQAPAKTSKGPSSKVPSTSSTK